MIAWLVALPMLGAANDAQRQPDYPAVRESVTMTGTVRLLNDLLRERGVDADADRLRNQIVLVPAEGVAVPLLVNPASRALAMDARLRERKTEVVGRAVKGLPHLEVVLFRVEDDSGALRIAEYFCEVCSITVRYDQICPCCAAAMTLRYQPVD